ncbi:MAG: flagellin [Defluviitaleaceae bacterium]|nr:flagellin [Defluviitaleaceae bacterium]
MRINTNIPALNAYTALTRIQSRISVSSRRLSTGLRINTAADDAAGRAISNKLRLQIRGLESASQNSSNAVSAIQTAEGALNEIHAMLQRINELTVYAANGTNTPEDVQKIQLEINQLKEEINSTARTTDFNRISLLNGAADRIINSSTANILRISDNLANSTFNFDLIAPATNSALASTTTFIGGTFPHDSALTINGIFISINAGETVDSAFAKLREAAEFAQLDITMSTDPNGVFESLTSRISGSEYPIVVNSSDAALLDWLGFDTSAGVVTANGIMTIMDIGDDVEIAIHTTTFPVSNSQSPLSANATVTSSGNRVTIRDTAGRLIVADIRPDLLPGNDFELMTLREGALFVQIGANQGDEMQVRIPRINTSTIGIDRLNVGTPDLAQLALNQIQYAINVVSQARAHLGAYQNRIEFTISNVDNNKDNTVFALSRIVDTDMAFEMIEYSKNNVLLQAGLAVIAQANQRPQSILQLIQ